MNTQVLVIGFFVALPLVFNVSAQSPDKLKEQLQFAIHACHAGWQEKGSGREPILNEPSFNRIRHFRWYNNNLKRELFIQTKEFADGFGADAFLQRLTVPVQTRWLQGGGDGAFLAGQEGDATVHMRVANLHLQISSSSPDLVLRIASRVARQMGHP